MAHSLTQEYLDKALTRLASKDDLAGLEERLEGKIEQVRTSSRDDLATLEARLEGKMEQLEERVLASFSDLQTSVDRYLKRTETWHDELVVLQARFSQVVDLLDQRGIIKEEETHVA